MRTTLHQLEASRRCLAAAALAVVTASAAAQNAEPARPFAPGEVLEYSVSLGGLPMTGTGALRVDGPEQRRGEEAWVLRFDIEASLAGRRVVHHARSWLSQQRFASLGYEMRETSPLGKAQANVHIDGAARFLDELSFIYLLRTLSLAPEASVQLHRHYDPKRNPVLVRVVGRERVTVGGAPVDAVVVEMRVKDPARFRKGVGVLRIHFTDDAARIPVRMELPSPLGPDLVLELTSASPSPARREP